MTRLLPLLLLAACIDTSRPPTEGTNGELRFTDLTNHVGGGFGAAGLGWAVAVGAEIDVGVYGWTEDDGEIAAGLPSGTAFELVRDIGVSVRLRAVEAGESTLHVIADDGREDEVVVKAAALDAVELVRTGDADLLSLITPAELADVGEAFLPGARAGLAAELYGGGERLTGEIVLDWPEVLHPEPFRSIANGAWLTLGAAGSYPVDLGFGPAWTFDVLPAEAPLTLTLYEPSYDPLVELTSITGAPGLLLIGLGVFDDQGRLVRTADDQTMEVEVLDGPADLLSGATYAPGLLGFTVNACPGTGTARIHLGAATLDVPVEITGEPVTGCEG